MPTVTWDENNKGSGVVLSNGNLTARIPNNANTVRASIGRSSGKWYWEINCDSISHIMIGIVNESASLNSINNGTQNVRLYSIGGGKYPEALSYGQSYTTGDVISILLDLDNGTLEFWKNGISQGISHININVLGMVYPAITSGSSTAGSTTTANFGEVPFLYVPPISFKPYNNEGNILIRDNKKILSYKKGEWFEVGTDFVSKNMFYNNGINCWYFNRSIQTISKPMSTNGTLGQGKTFSYELDLNKFHQIQSLDIS